MTARYVGGVLDEHDALVRQGIAIGTRTEIPEELVPADAQVEISAKRAAGYYTAEEEPVSKDLSAVKGRGITDF